MVSKTNSNITIATSQYHFQEEDVFGSQQGLGIAVSFESDFFDIDFVPDKSYGEIYFFSSEWGYDEDGKLFSTYTKLETYPCSKEEFSSEND